MLLLRQRYKRGARPAVDGVSLGVPRGQCFGLLGLNGAGKTSILKMLTGDTPLSGGDALVDKRSVRQDMDAVRRLVGYCPQVSRPWHGKKIVVVAIENQLPQPNVSVVYDQPTLSLRH